MIKTVIRRNYFPSLVSDTFLFCVGIISLIGKSCLTAACDQIDDILRCYTAQPKRKTIFVENRFKTKRITYRHHFDPLSPK